MAFDQKSETYDMQVYDMGLRIRHLRLQKKWTHEVLGHKIGVNKDTISNYENNLKTPSLQRLQKLAVVFYVSVDYLLGLENEPTIKIYNLSETQKRILHEFITAFIDKEN